MSVVSCKLNRFLRISNTAKTSFDYIAIVATADSDIVTTFARWYFVELLLNYIKLLNYKQRSKKRK